MVIKMNINKTHYKILGEPKKIYLDMTTLEIREKLNIAFKTPTCEDDMTGIFGKYHKSEKKYKVKYIFARNNQLQPQTYERYYYLVDVDEDEKGAYVEYVMVYDKFYDPFIRIVYILAALGVFAYLYYRFKINSFGQMSTIVMGAIIFLSIILVFKKSKETQYECEKAKDLFINLVKEM